jgi:hypothetical protein
VEQQGTQLRPAVRLDQVVGEGAPEIGLGRRQRRPAAGRPQPVEEGALAGGELVSAAAAEIGTHHVVEAEHLASGVEGGPELQSSALRQVPEGGEGGAGDVGILGEDRQLFVAALVIAGQEAQAGWALG